MENDWTREVDRLRAEKAELLEACRMAYRVLLQIDDHEDYTTRTLNELNAAIAKAERKEP